MTRINWRMILERIEYDEKGNPQKRTQYKQVITEEMLHGSVLHPENIIQELVVKLYKEIQHHEEEEG